jgi:serine/threonine-protein kinase RsbW
LPARFDELTIGANAAEARRASEWLETACQQRDVPPAQAERLVLCLNEVLANVITHGCKTEPSEPIRLLLEVALDQDGSTASVTVSDACMAFDPLSVPRRALPKTLDEASPGGMGLEIIRRGSDLLQYRHENGHNHLTFGTRWDPA